MNVPRDRVSGEPIPWKGFRLKEITQRTKWTQLTGEPGFRVDMKFGQDFVIIDSESQMSDVADDQSVELVDVGMDIIVRDLELVFHLNR